MTTTWVANPMVPLHLPDTLFGVVVYVIGLVILWAIISIPVYFAGKAITKGRSDYGDAMGATLGGAIGYFLVYFGVAYFLGAVMGSSANVLAVVLALLVWLAAYRAAFRTTWVKAVSIVILSWIILLIIDFIVVHAFGVTFPDFFPFA